MCLNFKVILIKIMILFLIWEKRFTSYLNQQLIVSNLQNQSVKEKTTGGQDDYYNPLVHAC